MADLALYLHIPYCRHRCNYCSFVSSSGRELEIPLYVQALATEIHLKRMPDATVKSIYFGGGTPSLLPASQIKQLLNTIGKDYRIDDRAEITLEANPGTIDTDYLKALSSAGINRLSLGIQSLDDTELRLLGRIHTAADGLKAIEQSREAGFNNLNLDFIYGIPGRDINEWEHMLHSITDQAAPHLSLYALTLEDDTLLATKIQSGEIPAPDADNAASEYEMACKLLAEAGYQQYEISNWAKPGMESRHNLVYWQRQPYLGLGAAAHSMLGSERRANTSNIERYINALNNGCPPEETVEVIDEKLALAETIILGLRLNRGISADDIQSLFKVDLYQRFATEIADLTAFGLLEREGARLKLTPRGRLLGNEVFWRFLPD
jgi:oxygen-independent coproporphyrinogen-3 oxidase